jgi:hypothetical protein
MIVLSLMQMFLELVGGLVTAALAFIGAPPDVVFEIPSPFFAIFAQFINSVGLALPALTIFYLWRQAKA